MSDIYCIRNFSSPTRYLNNTLDWRKRFAIPLKLGQSVWGKYCLWPTSNHCHATSSKLMRWRNLPTSKQCLGAHSASSQSSSARRPAGRQQPLLIYGKITRGPTFSSRLLWCYFYGRAATLRPSSVELIVWLFISLKYRAGATVPRRTCRSSTH